MGTVGQDEAMYRSAIYSALALGFGDVTEEQGRKLTSKRGSAALAHLLEEVDAPEAASAARRLAQRKPDGELHQRLFGHTSRGVVSPYETEYGAVDMFQQPHQLADIGAFAGAFGLRFRGDSGERVDHVRCECELMGFLAQKEAYAIEEGDAEMLEETRRAEGMFLREHLSRFAPSLGESLRREDPDGFYGALGQVLKSFVDTDCLRLGLAPSPAGLELRLDEDDPTPMACGTCGVEGGCDDLDREDESDPLAEFGP